MKRIAIAAMALAGLAALVAAPDISKAQSANPFNPDYAWCNVQGSVATRQANAWACLTPGTAGQVLRTNGAGANVSWQTVTGAGTVTSVGLAMPSIFSVSGSPVTTTGTLTAALASQTTNLVFASPNGTSGTPSFRALALADVPQMDAAHLPNAGVVTGSVITGTFPALTIGSGQITNAMLAGSIAASNLATQADGTILSNVSGAVATPSANTINQVMSKQFGTTTGAMIYRGASVWQSLSPGIAGQYLQSNGGAAPSWVTPVITPTQLTGTLQFSGRLTVTTATPIAYGTSTTLYYTPYNGNVIPIFDGTNFIPTPFTELSQTASDTTKSPAAAVANGIYDIFVWNDGGTLRATRGPAWTNSTTRATAISLVNGVYVNGASITNGPASGMGTYVGTVLMNASTQFQSSVGGNAAGGIAPYLGIWNKYNRVPFKGVSVDATVSLAGPSATTVTQVGTSTGNGAFFVNGETINAEAQGIVRVLCNSMGSQTASIYLDGATTGGPFGYMAAAATGSNSGTTVTQAIMQAAPGSHTLAFMQQNTASGACASTGAGYEGFTFQSEF